MAPEMAAADGPNIDERTDVFLLGAILHELLTGASRHDGKTPLELLAAAWRSPAAKYDDTVPVELAELANRATARDPNERVQSMRAFRAALVSYERHANSRLLNDNALQRLTELRELIEADADPSAVADAFIECRLGFRAALQSWADNPAAHDGLQEALRLMVAFELARDHLEAAVSLASGLRESDPAIEAAIEELAERVAAERERAADLERMEQQRDLRFGTRTRAFIALIFAVIFGAIPVGAGYAKRSGDFVHTHLDNLGVATGFAVLLIGLFIWARDTLTRTEFNRRTTQSLAVVAFSSFLLAFALWAADMPADAALPLSLLMYTIYMGSLAAFLDNRLFLSAGAHAVAFTAAVVWPQWAYEATGAGHFMSSILVAWFWRPSKFSGDYDGHAALVPRDR